jgi:structural maintenance of chromosomes protein 5
MSFSRLQRLSNIEHQKLQRLRQSEPDSAATVEWLRRNQHLFQMEVLEPPCLTLKVKDARYADQIDACFNGVQMRTFVTQCMEDNRTLNRLVNDTPEALGKKARIATWFRPRQNTNPPPMTQEEMGRLGFDTYAIDQVDYPEGLLWYLENHISLHRTAIALNPRGVDSNAAMHAVSNPATGGSANFIVGRVYNQVQRSHYGQRLPTNTTRDIAKTRNFGDQTG